MIANAERLRRTLVDPRSAIMLAMFNCVCAVQVTMAQEVSGRVQRHLNQADSCRAIDDFECARAALKEIPTRDLSRFEQYRYWTALGYVEFLDGNFPGAIEAYRNAAAYSPAPAQRQYHLRSVAQLHASLGQFEDAYKTLEELMVQNGADPLKERHLTNDGLWRGLGIYVIGDRDRFPLGRVQPEYPPEAAAQGLLQGRVDLELTVTPTGSTRDIRIIESSAQEFESAAVEAAKRFRYKPRLIDGEPVETVVRERVEFEPVGSQ